MSRLHLTTHGRYQLLGRLSDQTLEELVRLAAAALSAPIAVAAVLPRDGGWFSDAVGVPPAEAVALALESEKRVTRQINALVDLAIKERDHLSKNMLEWFVNEQREEVASMDTLLRMVKRAGESGLFFVDNFLLQGGLSEGEAEGEEAN